MATKEIVNPYLMDIADRISEWLSNLDEGLSKLKEAYNPSDEKHRKEVYRVLESTQDQAFRIGTLLSKELAKLKADKLAELNPIVGVMSSHILSTTKKIQAMFPEEANSISGWKKVAKELKAASDQSAQMAKIMSTTGVPDVVIIPSTPLFERSGAPTKAAENGAKKKEEKKEEPKEAPAPAPVEPGPTEEPVAPPME